MLSHFGLGLLLASVSLPLHAEEEIFLPDFFYETVLISHSNELLDNKNTRYSSPEAAVNGVCVAQERGTIASPLSYSPHPYSSGASYWSITCDVPSPLFPGSGAFLGVNVIQRFECPGLLYNQSMNGADGSRYYYNYLDKMCHRTKQSAALTLHGLGGEVEPSGTAAGAGNSNRTAFARVVNAQTNAPKPGVQVRITVDVNANSGGHDHHDVDRAKGKLFSNGGGTCGPAPHPASCVTTTTDGNGNAYFVFTAPQAAGIHTIKATCSTCSNSSVSQEIKVKVPDLIQIPPDTQTPPRYVLVGQRSEHRKSHFVTEAGLDVLNQVIRAFARLGWGQVGINDASLEWGGMFDIEGKWLKPYMNNKGKWVTGGHAEHRNGEQVDISFARPASVSMQLRKKAYREVCNNNRTSLSPDILWHENDGYAPHFHIYLTGKAGAPAAGKTNQCTKK